MALESENKRIRLYHRQRQPVYLCKYHVAPGICQLVQQVFPDTLPGGFEPLLFSTLELSQGFALK